MPKWLKKSQEPLWERAKSLALKTYKESDDAFWPVVTTIFEQLGGKPGKAEASYCGDTANAVKAMEASAEARRDKKAGDVTKHESFAWDKRTADFHGITGEERGRHVFAHAYELHHGEFSQAVAPSGAVHMFGTSSFHPSEKAAHKEFDDLIKRHKEIAGHETMKTSEKITSENVIHCKVEQSMALPESPDWKMGSSVKFAYVPAGVHTICAGFCGPVTKDRPASIELTVEVQPERDAAVCQASLEAQRSQRKNQDLYCCFEHDEKQASVWATRFEAGNDPVLGQPAVLLEGKPSGSGADAVNRRDWRSFSPSFGTDADYTKCKCRNCEEALEACECRKPALYFPDGAVGSVGNPAKITGVAFVLGTLTNRPAFRAMPPVKAKEEGNPVQVTADNTKRATELLSNIVNATWSDAAREAAAEARKAKSGSSKFGSEDYAANMSAAAHKFSKVARTRHEHFHAAKLHDHAAEAHEAAGTSEVDEHREMAEAHRGAGEEAGVKNKVVLSTEQLADGTIKATWSDAAREASAAKRKAAAEASKSAFDLSASLKDGAGKAEHAPAAKAHRQAEKLHKEAAESLSGSGDPHAKAYHESWAKVHGWQAAGHERGRHAPVVEAVDAGFAGTVRSVFGNAMRNVVKAFSMSFDTLRELVGKAAQADARFNKKPDEETAKAIGSPGCSVWVQDVLCDYDGDGDWYAVIQGADGKSYKVAFKVEGGKAKFISGAQEVTRSTQYVAATDKCTGSVLTTWSDAAREASAEARKGKSKAHGQMLDLHAKIRDVQEQLGKIDWSKHHVNDQKLGEHWNAVEQHLDDAAGRLSTAIQHTGRLDSKASPAVGRFNEYGNVVDTEKHGNRHVTEFEDSDLSKEELALKRKALKEGHEEVGARSASKPVDTILASLKPERERVAELLATVQGGHTRTGSVEEILRRLPQTGAPRTTN